LEPDLTLVLDLPLEVALSRRKANADRLESRGDDYFERVRAGFLAEARRRPERFHVIDASAPSEIVQERIRAACSNLAS
jgi:dTMP kinase